MSIFRIWRAAANRTYVKVQCVCLVVIGCYPIVLEVIDYKNHISLGHLLGGIINNVYQGFFITLIPAIVFSAIIPVLLIKRIRMRWPMWMDYVLVETGLLLIVVIIVAIFLIILEPIFPLSKALRIFGSISIVVLPIAGLGVLSCQRVLKRYMKEDAQPANPPYSESAARSPQG